MMKIREDSGFSAIEALLIVTLLGIVGFTGWFVHNATNKANTSLDKAASSKNAITKSVTQKTEPEVVIPDDWQWFTSADKTIKFPYPKTWGTLTQPTAGSPIYSPDRYIQVAAIDKKSDFLVHVRQGYVDYTWYSWDSSMNGLVSAVDTNPPADYTSDYTSPVALGATKMIEPLINTNGFNIYQVLGNGEENCGGHSYFFAVDGSVVELGAGLCDRGGPYQPQAGQSYVDDVEGPLAQMYKYIQDYFVTLTILRILVLGVRHMLPIFSGVALVRNAAIIFEHARHV